MVMIYWLGWMDVVFFSFVIGRLVVLIFSKVMLLWLFMLRIFVVNLCLLLVRWMVIELVWVMMCVLVRMSLFWLMMKFEFIFCLFGLGMLGGGMLGMKWCKSLWWGLLDILGLLLGNWWLVIILIIIGFLLRISWLKLGNVVDKLLVFFGLIGGLVGENVMVRVFFWEGEFIFEFG